MGEKPVRLLVVDDQPELRALLKRYLTQEGYQVEAVGDGAAMERYLRDHPVDLIILDLMLPGDDGLTLARRLRSQGNQPIIIISARGEEVDRIVGLEMGADDYLAKPFNPRELAARIRAVLRRVEGGGAQLSVLAAADLELDSGARRVVVGGDEIDLTGVEFTILECLLRSLGQVVGRDELSREALGRRASSIDRSLDVHVSNLRRKLGQAPGGGDRIKTVRGVGYQYIRPPAGSP